MSWSHPAFEDLARLVSVQTGLDFTSDRRTGAELGIRRAMGRAGINAPARYRDLILADAAALDDMIAELTIGETYFFREPAQFQFIRRAILPEICSRRGDWHVIRAWSACCSSGEEAYSLAMVFSEEGLGGRSNLLATDISRTALVKARTAAYGNWSLRGDGAEAARTHLRRQGDRYVVEDSIQRLVSFRLLNLAIEDYRSAACTGEMDLILCRNVLIYFDKKTVRAVAARLHASLAEGGWLLTASSDPPLSDDAPFESVVTEQGVFYRRSTATCTRGGDDATKWLSAGFPTIVTASSGPVNEVPSQIASLEVPSQIASLIPPACRTGEDIAFSFSGAEKANIGVETGDLDLAPGDVLPAARADFARGDYARAAERTCDRADDEPDVAALHVRALANLDPVKAELACARATRRHALSGELHYLHAVTLLALGRNTDAARSARRALYLDRSLAIVHFTLGSILRCGGDALGAMRAYRNARDLCEACPPDETVVLSEGEPSGRLAEAARTQMVQMMLLLEAPA